MSFSESLKQAFDSLRANKLRSILTMVGIIMGVFSVIAIMAIGNAASSYVIGQFEKIGANTITVQYKVKNPSKYESLTLDDMDTIKNTVPEIKNIAAWIQRSGELRINEKTRDAVILGVSSQFRSFSPAELSNGRFITDIDISARSKVAVVDEFFAKRYFNSTDIIGQYVYLRTSWGSRVKLKIIGVLEGGDDLLISLMDNENIPTAIYMPIKTVQELYGNDQMLNDISVTVEGDEDLKEIGNKIVKSLEAKHGKKDLYYASNSADTQKMFSNILGVISSVLLVIAIITLLVGGIGIVNILLVSVTERIREIGIRKALGAQKKDIVFQFLTESIMMTGFSGLIGILLGVIAGSVISSLIKIPPVVDIKVITLAFLGSIALGVIFGVYPAKKAADLDPIESLRYE